MSLRETFRRKQRAIESLWKVVKSLPQRLEQAEANLDAVRRALDKDYRQRCETEEGLARMAHKSEVEMFKVTGNPDGSAPRFDGIAQHGSEVWKREQTAVRDRISGILQQVQTRPVSPIRAPEGWHPGDDDDEE